MGSHTPDRTGRDDRLPRRAPGEEYNPGAPTEPRQAATVMLVRGGEQALEVLLVRRNPAARFMGGVWVFPGGAVDRGDGKEREGERREANRDPREDNRDGREAGRDPRGDQRDRREADRDRPGHGDDDRAHRSAAMRELREEAGVTLGDPGGLVAFSRWITPAEVRTRFDTRFYLAALPEGQEAKVDGRECVALGWFAPDAALDAHEKGELELVFPTIAHLRELSRFSCADELLAHARGLVVEPVLPRVVVDGDSARVVLPGEPGY